MPEGAPRSIADLGSEEELHRDRPVNQEWAKTGAEAVESQEDYLRRKAAERGNIAVAPDGDEDDEQ